MVGGARYKRPGFRCSKSSPMRKLLRSSNIVRRSQAQIEASQVAHVHHHVTITEGDDDQGRASHRKTALTVHEDRRIPLDNEEICPAWLDHSLLERILDFEDDVAPTKRWRTNATVCSV